MRVGKHYKLVNFEEIYEFVVLDIMDNGDYKLKTIDTLEVLMLSDLVKYGTGSDFYFGELWSNW